MREYMFEYDTIEGFCGTAYVWAKSHADAKRQIREELKLYGGGHADVYTDGTLRFDVEVQSPQPRYGGALLCPYAELVFDKTNVLCFKFVNIL